MGTKMGTKAGIKTVTKEKSSSTTMNDLVNIVSTNWRVPDENLNEVYPGIFIGDEIAAKDIGLLRELKITHILNAAYSERKSFLYAHTSQKFYDDQKFECAFMGLSAVDCITCKLAKYFEEASDFIDLVVNCPHSKVLVHCRQGVSRSATFVIVYLMLKKGMTAKEAVTLVRQHRKIFPNKGFLKEICDLEQTISKSKNKGKTDGMSNQENGVKQVDIVTEEVEKTNENLETYGIPRHPTHLRIRRTTTTIEETFISFKKQSNENRHQ